MTLEVTYTQGDVELIDVPDDGRWRMSHDEGEIPALVVVHHSESHIRSKRTIIPASSIRKVEVSP